MDINTLAAWGEFLGGIAVVVSLVYLAGQIRQNSKLLRASTAGATAQIEFSGAALLVQDAEVARIFWEGLADRNALSEADRQRFDPLLSVQLRGQNRLYEFHREGLASPGGWQPVERGLRWTFQQPGVQQWWHVWGEGYSDEFRSLVDGMIREGEAAG